MITISKEELSSIVFYSVKEAIAEAMASKTLARPVKQNDEQWHINYIVKNIGKVKKYAKHKRYGKPCSMGQMPHSLLLNLSGIKKDDFNIIIEKAVQEGRIREVASEVYNGKTYELVPTFR